MVLLLACGLALLVFFNEAGIALDRSLGRNSVAMGGSEYIPVMLASGAIPLGLSIPLGSVGSQAWRHAALE